MNEPVVPVWRYSFVTAAGKTKTIQILCGDICQATEEYDLVVCSAFKNNYWPTPRTLIGALWEECGISVADLAKSPVLDLKSMGCWLSGEIPAKFHRVACVEILDLSERRTSLAQSANLLAGVFSSLRFILEQAQFRGITIRSVISPVLGAGSQGIELGYIAGPLIRQCMQALQTIDSLECFTFCERRMEKAEELAAGLKKAVDSDLRPDVFISYSSRQSELACQMRESFLKKDLHCWMAPESIPAGSSYLSEIPLALSKTPLVVLLLTPDAENSRWVQKEIGTAVGSDCILLPYQPFPYTVGTTFRFALDGEQIFCGWQYAEADRLNQLALFAAKKLSLRRQTGPAADL